MIEMKQSKPINYTMLKRNNSQTAWNKIIVIVIVKPGLEYMLMKTKGKFMNKIMQTFCLKIKSQTE